VKRPPTKSRGSSPSRTCPKAPCSASASEGGGCSGLSYSLNFDTNTTEHDRVGDIHGVKLAVDKKFDPYLDGTVVDFYDGLEKRGFVFNNPNVAQTCCCGSSFQV